MIVTKDKYYLNHVGYKELMDCLKTHWTTAYYLNHVGYKESQPLMGFENLLSYYLNHVGYKGSYLYFSFFCFCVLSEPCGI